MNKRSSPICLLLVLASCVSAHAQASSICDGLSGVSAATPFQEVLALTQVDQAPNQFRVTGCWDNSLFNTRPACQRRDRFGQINGRFGSCATYSGFSAAVAIADVLNIDLPAQLHYTPQNLVRIYDAYGNPWDTQSPGVGSFPHILHNVLSEVAGQLPAGDRRRSQLLGFAKRYRYQATSDAMVAAVAQHFSSSQGSQLVPIEVILDGWVLDHSPASYCPIRNDAGMCDDVNGQDQRAAHSALIVGRQVYRGECHIEVRNSWKGCRNGRYGKSNHNCFVENDFVWVREADLLRGVSGVRIPQ